MEFFSRILVGIFYLMLMALWAGVIIFLIYKFPVVWLVFLILGLAYFMGDTILD